VLILGEMGVCGVDFQPTNIDNTIFDLFSSNLGNLSKYAAIALGGICIVTIISPNFRNISQGKYRVLSPVDHFCNGQA